MISTTKQPRETMLRIGDIVEEIIAHSEKRDWTQGEYLRIQKALLAAGGDAANLRYLRQSAERAGFAVPTAPRMAQSA